MQHVAELLLVLTFKKERKESSVGMNVFDITTNVFLNATVSISLNTGKNNAFMHFFFACSVNLESLTCQIDIVLLPRHQTPEMLQIMKCVGKLHVLRRDLLYSVTISRAFARKGQLKIFVRAQKIISRAMRKKWYFKRFWGF